MPRRARSKHRIMPAGPPPTTQQEVWSVLTAFGDDGNGGEGTVVLTGLICLCGTRSAELSFAGLHTYLRAFMRVGYISSVQYSYTNLLRYNRHTQDWLLASLEMTSRCRSLARGRAEGGTSPSRTAATGKGACTTC